MRSPAAPKITIVHGGAGLGLFTFRSSTESRHPNVAVPNGEFVSTAAGNRTFALIDPISSLRVPLVVLYPSAIDGADTPFAAGRFPLVVVSHGNGGSGMLYRTMALHLARNGFIVALPDHPGNNRTDNDLARTVANLEYRPQHIRLVIDWIYGESPFAPLVKRDCVALIGHSLGGYTALALAGGRATAFARETPEQQPRAIAVVPDARLKALVLLAPATVWFEAPGALDRLRVPMLVIEAEYDEHTPAFHGDIVERGVPIPARVDRHTVAGAGHFSFLDPYPESMRTPSFPPALDPPGFDRAAFLVTLSAEVLAFLQRVL